MNTDPTPPPPAAPFWLGPLAAVTAAAGLFAARAADLPDTVRPLLDNWAILGHALTAGLLAALFGEWLRARAQANAANPHTWSEQALQACLDQVRALPSLTDRHEILASHRIGWSARLGWRWLLYLAAGGVPAFLGLLASLGRLSQPGAPADFRSLFLPLTVGAFEALAVSLAALWVGHDWTAALLAWQQRALVHYDEAAQAVEETPRLPAPKPAPSKPTPNGDGHGPPAAPAVKTPYTVTVDTARPIDTVKPEEFAAPPKPPEPPAPEPRSPSPFDTIWGGGGSPFGGPAVPNPEPPPDSDPDPDPGPDYGR
jgi:hypothetical protein